MAYKPQNLIEALSIRAWEDVIVFAGGTDLMVKKKNWSGLPPAFEKPVLFIAHLQELKKIRACENCISIGASCTLTELLENELVPEILKESISNMASPAVRNVATIGGNICNASPAGDTLPFLYAIDATVVLKTISGERYLPIKEFILGPAQTAIGKKELLTEIRIPHEGFNVWTYRKVGTRKAMALSKLSFLGMAKINNNAIVDVRVAFGAVAPTVVRSRDIEKEVIHIPRQHICKTIPEILEKYSRLIKPIDDQRSTAEYRKTVSLRLLEDFLKEVFLQK